jgi:hypothetical protein
VKERRDRKRKERTRADKETLRQKVKKRKTVNKKGSSELEKVR